MIDSFNELSELKSLSRESYLRVIENKKNIIFNHHYNNNTWYRNFIGEKKVSKWEDIPIIRKRDLQNFSNFSSKTISGKNNYFANTSGSSGNPLYFWKNKYCHGIAWAYIIKMYSNLGITKNDIEGRFIGHVKESYKYQIKEKIKDYFFNRLRFDVFDLSENNMNDYVQKFLKNNIGYVYGYTNVILEFSKFIIENNKPTIASICPTLKLCIITAEICSQYDRKIIEKAFGVPVYIEYGSSETSIIAIEDKLFNWGIATERIWIEILDEEDNLVEKGGDGKIIVTDLYNTSFPFVRYELGDLGSIVYSEEYPYLILNKLLGRQSDMIYLSNGKRSPGLTFYYILRSVIENNEFEIREFKIIQIALNHFIFLIVSNFELKEKEKNILIKETERYLQESILITFKRVNKIEKKYSNKIQNFFSEIA